MVAERLKSVLAQIALYPNAKLIAVSKGQSLEKIREAYRFGQRDFGENYAQELCAKSEQLLAEGLSEIRWHFIGSLQSNKVRQVLPVVSSIHTVSSRRLAEEISKRWSSSGSGKKISVFAEVNIDHETGKHGFPPEEVVYQLRAMKDLPGLDWRGLMCIPARTGGMSGDSFQRLAELERQCRPVTSGELSMGMSDDYSVALREGAGASRVWVRLGTGVFGPRESRQG
ncbi:MAG: YggS family pyridoxal phosphate-dependent enzyme [Bdellovibrionales bacterium]|nr:YggS family pyridoxal phosphate-dependent enzyme [Bdellovibrionales bacterium]